MQLTKSRNVPILKYIYWYQFQTNMNINGIEEKNYEWDISRKYDKNMDRNIDRSSIVFPKS